MDQKWIVPLLLAALIAWGIYRRLRRTFGRQPVAPRRLYARAVILAVLGALLLVFSARSPATALAMVSGLAAGLVLGHYGLRHTLFESTATGRYYTPHTYIGLVVTALFFGRLAFRFLRALPDAHAAMQGDQNPLAAYQRSPLTLAVFGVLVGYYVYYNLGVVRRSRDTPRADPPPRAT